MKISNKYSILITLAIVLGGPVSLFAAGPAAVNLGTADNFVILAKTGVSATGITSVIGNIGISPAAASYITGFGLYLTAAGAFSTSASVNGNIYAPGYADPTPAVLTAAVLDMQNAYTDAAGRTTPTATDLGSGNIGGLTFIPGIYKWATDVTIPTDITLSGGANDVWIFQIAQKLDISSDKNIILIGGAQSKNIFWQVAGQATIGTGADFKGNILGQTAVVLNTGATLDGRALAQTAVTLDANTVTIPIASVSTPTPTPTPTSTPTPTTTPTPTSVATPTPTPTPTPVISSDARVAALQIQLSNLMASLKAIQDQRAAAQGNSASASSFGQQVKAIATSLGQGSRDNNVSVLQQFLISQKKGPKATALAGAGSTAYFGALTRAALAEFQASVGISPASGYFGAITRAYLKANF